MNKIEVRNTGLNSKTVFIRNTSDVVLNIGETWLLPWGVFMKTLEYGEFVALSKNDGSRINKDVDVEISRCDRNEDFRIIEGGGVII